MLRKITVILVLLAFMLAAVPVYAAHESAPAAHDRVAQNSGSEPETQAPVVFKGTITVTAEGGIFQVGFAELTFKKDFLSSDMLPVTFEVEISAVDGVAGIEFSPDVPDFCRNVHIKVDSPYKGLLYDKSTGQNIQVNVKKQQIVAKHFSRYAFS